MSEPITPEELRAAADEAKDGYVNRAWLLRAAERIEELEATVRHWQDRCAEVTAALRHWQDRCAEVVAALKIALEHAASTYRSTLCDSLDASRRPSLAELAHVEVTAETPNFAIQEAIADRLAALDEEEPS